MADLSLPNSERCLRVLRQTPDILRNLLSLATPEQLDWRPSAERWSICMVLAHLADVEIRGFRSRFEAMLETERPWLPSYDQLALFRCTTEFDPYAEMACFEERRGETLALLEGLPEGAGERSGQHAELRDHHGRATGERVRFSRFGTHPAGHGTVPLARILS